MKAPHDVGVGDSDSGHSPIDDEKRVGVAPGGFEELGRHELPPDPDGHLSDAERAAIVRRSSPACGVSVARRLADSVVPPSNRTRSCC